MNASAEKALHRWGFQDTEFIVHEDRSVELTGSRYEICGTRMPSFIPFVESSLGVRVDLSDMRLPRQRVAPEPKRNAGFFAALAAEFEEAKYSFDAEVRLAHSHGQATADEIYAVLYSSLPRVVDMVFFCSTERDAERIVALAREHAVCLVPYGGGTNVTGCLLPPQDDRMVVSVDMGRMNRIEWLNPSNRQVCVQAGITGRELEEQLQRQGFTTGHEPDSIEFSTLGGWISTNASGMKRNRYGAIENIVDSVSVVTPQGRLDTLGQFPRQSAGVQVKEVLFGSEGNFGLITKAVLRIRALPEVKTYQSLVFPDARRGVAFLFELSNSSILPASIRLVDNGQFRFGLALKPASGRRAQLKSLVQRVILQGVKRVDPKQMVVATIGMEGTPMEVRAQEAALADVAARHQGFFAGASNGKRGYNLTFAIAYIRDFMTKLQVLGETLETTLPWDKIHDVVAAVRDEAQQIHRECGLPGKPFLSYRVTQLYASGACVYFTYAVSMKGIENPGAIASQAEDRLRHTIVRNGGAVSNHHGVGKFRSQLLASVLPPMNAEIIRGLKATVDPSNVFGAQNGVFLRGFGHPRPEASAPGQGVFPNVADEGTRLPPAGESQRVARVR
jgi:alkyldihydroxyacetonephosphate synthase